MDSINFNTTHNVFLEYKAAGLVERIIASFIDLIILVFYSIFLSLIFLTTFLLDTTYLYFIFLTPVVFYDLIFETLANGQSIGKKVMEIRVIRTDGLEPTIVQYFLRWILRPIDIWFSSGGLAALVIFLNGKGQRIGDLAAGTMVVSLKSQISLDDTLFSETDDSFYIPEFPEAVKLSESDINTCKDLLKANRLPEIPTKVIEGNYKVKNILEEKMGVKSDKSPLDFINKVVKDYTHYNREI
ncbi:MAG: RDD family protein [Candidatus Kapabacteria bacterium]|nr:RDD family protein [Ignavibacteriota bacterium]MCW5886113.1 RDD family protein [Candidatus Kapabacteria bacterium]